MLKTLAILVALVALVGHAHAQCSNPANAIVAENCLPGSPASEWDVGNGQPGDPTIQGFATDISVNQGGTIYFKIDTPASAYTITIYRMGYYGGMGARQIATVTPSVSLPQTQPACVTDTSTGLIDCGNWAVSASWTVPTNATSGVYFAHLVRSDTGGDSHIVFIVRNDSSNSNIIYQTSDETWEAYNYYGAGSLYGPASPTYDLAQRSYKVSYNRPFLTRGFAIESDTWVFGAEFAMIQWLEENGYDVTYTTDIDAVRNPSLIENHKIWMDAGHDEYWSGPERAAVQAALNAGVNLAFFTGNEMFWKTRWENSIDGTNTPYRTLVCYKETLAFSQIDPDDPPTWTGTWRDPTFSPPADGGQPENNVTGTLFMVNGTGPDNDGSQQIQIPQADGQMRFWRNTAVANLGTNQTYITPQGTLGYEWDEDIDNGFRPAGAFHLSTSTYTLTSDLLLDEGATYGAGTATHHAMMYRASSGALVFGAGTIDWSWGLDSNHDNPFDFAIPAPDPNMQQATVNLFADMGVQPATLQAGLVAATASTDTTPPTSVITYPTAGTTLNTGATITVTGTATDAGGGVVAGVEVSGDTGNTWHPATGRSSWSYAWTPSITGSTTLMTRAVDDSGNLETPHGINLTVVPQTCPCTIWNASAVPSTVDSGDGNSVEVGLKFRADSNGSILGVRFYKALANTGTHVAHLWSDTGTLLGTATFSGESSSGWQQVNFSSPIPISANTVYVVSYFAPNGHYSADSIAFATAGVDDPPLHALANNVDGADGVYVYSSTPGTFPNASFDETNYWVDVVFTSSNTYNISGTISGPGGSGATVNLTGTETLSTAADSSGNYTFDGVPNGTYTVTPSNSGVTFTPSSQTVTINGGVATGVNFTAVVTNPQTISGTISGTGGAGATVNLSGGATLTTTANSSGNYSFTGLLSGSYTVDPSATDVLFTPGIQTVNLTGAGATGVNFSAQVCNCVSIWPTSATPAVIDSGDGTPIEVGVAFTSSVPGSIYGLRFYKASTNTGTHVGHIWSSSGTLLGTATFSNETASGWQQVTFSSPIAISPNTTYIASYFAPNGHYSADTSYFANSGVSNPPLQALQNESNAPNGLYLYSSAGGFPVDSYESTNYWVDVLFIPGQSYTISGTISGANASGATVSLINGSTTTTITANSSGNYTFSTVFAGLNSIIPSNTNAAFVPPVQNVTISNASITGVNFAESTLCPCNTIWQPTATPAVVDSGDGSSVETGVKFQAGYDGYILGIRFYKASTNTGTHIGNLWSNTGTLLATSTFNAESSSGWQEVIFADPVPVSANTSYVASYFAPQGHYSYSSAFFASSGVNNPPLQALAAGADGPNGIYTYSSTSTFPSGSYNSTNYWVDVVYAQATTFSITGTLSGTGGAGATVTLSGASSATTVADSSGNYSFSGLADGTYTVTPSTTSGVTFSPASQTVTIDGGHALGVNFTAVQPTYSISGTVSGASGDTVALSGTATATTITNSSGNYSFTGLANGSYTVTPGTAGFTVSPSSQTVTVNGANVSSVNFTGTVVTYTISGTISGGAGATISLAGAASATTTANSSGNFSFTGLGAGSYTLTPSGSGMVFTPTSLTASVSGANITGANFTVPSNCPCDTIWQPSSTPTNVDVSDNNSVELGVLFSANAPGYIAGVRFYKSSANTGTHQGNLWSTTGTLLGTATFANETASGWQQVLFANPVPIQGNTPYIASYFAPAGNYSGDGGFFASSGVSNPPLQALQNGVSGPNGVYTYSSTSAFPSSTYNSANYWVDVIYLPTTTYSITGSISGAGGPGATVTLGGASTATTTANASGNFSFSGLANGTYTVTPTLSGHSYSPTSQTATINNAHVLGLTFTSQ